MTTEIAERYCICAHCRGKCSCFTGIGWTPHCSFDHPVAGAVKRMTPAPICDGMKGIVVGSQCEDMAVGYLVNPKGDKKTYNRFCQDCGENAAAKANKEGLAGVGWLFAPEPGGVPVPAPRTPR